MLFSLRVADCVIQCVHDNDIYLQIQEYEVEYVPRCPFAQHNSLPKVQTYFLQTNDKVPGVSVVNSI